MMRLLFLFLLVPMLVTGQETDDKKESLFVVLYTVGENWNTEKSPNEQPYFKDHSAFLKKLRNDTIITLGARYADTGMIVLKAPNLDAAKKLVNSDIAVQHHLFNVEVHAFAPFYKGCIE
ncbi:YciI family protein [Allomuricauda sp. SCSIO 65647]|uniref:YciI family protein n=1 Tax=Allomuricauda sp. SCSIO 65647 TaxID=2908843 RepID=UPI001F2FA920|nr:hypothetical protein [Muricauda sp. SCSIO 65647]UJH66047.1 hypothetical protein L0P89_08670 [Muricauda sp. SCSIO 65647]